MTYDEFVEHYCNGMTPTSLQKCTIESWLEYPKGHILWMTKNGGGKSTCLEWLREAWIDRGEWFLDATTIGQAFRQELDDAVMD